MRFPFVALGLLAGLSVVACSVLSEDDADTQEANHTEGDPTFAQHEWLWADETEEEFRKNAVENASSWMGPADFLPLDHPMTVRLQYWIDRMDDVLRTQYPGKLKATPKPKLIVRMRRAAPALGRSAGSVLRPRAWEDGAAKRQRGDYPAPRQAPGFLQSSRS
jgi:hypothetical protein